jgi:beta-lactamase class A
MDRRTFILGPGAGLLWGLSAWPDQPAWADPGYLQESLRDIEVAARGRLGVHVIDTGIGSEFG